MCSRLEAHGWLLQFFWYTHVSESCSLLLGPQFYKPFFSALYIKINQEYWLNEYMPILIKWVKTLWPYFLFDAELLSYLNRFQESLSFMPSSQYQTYVWNLRDPKRTWVQVFCPIQLGKDFVKRWNITLAISPPITYQCSRFIPLSFSLPVNIQIIEITEPKHHTGEFFFLWNRCKTYISKIIQGQGLGVYVLQHISVSLCLSFLGVCSLVCFILLSFFPDFHWFLPFNISVF